MFLILASSGLSSRLSSFLVYSCVEYSNKIVSCERCFVFLMCSYMHRSTRRIQLYLYLSVQSFPLTTICCPSHFWSWTWTLHTQKQGWKTSYEHPIANPPATHQQKWFGCPWNSTAASSHGSPFSYQCKRTKQEPWGPHSRHCIGSKCHAKFQCRRTEPWWRKRRCQSNVHAVTTATLWPEGFSFWTSSPHLLLPEQGLSLHQQESPRKTLQQVRDQSRTWPSRGPRTLQP